MRFEHVEARADAVLVSLAEEEVLDVQELAWEAFTVGHFAGMRGNAVALQGVRKSKKLCISNRSATSLLMLIEPQETSGRGRRVR